jgi:protein-tyrosine phosphatase
VTGYRERVIDLHSHVLHGLDDGARDLDEALAMARSMVEDGISAVAATPHVHPRYRTPVEEMERALGELRAALVEAGIPLEVLPGGEIALDELPGLSRDERVRFGLGGNPRLLLLEFPLHGWPLDLETIVRDLGADGIVCVLAHPERNPDVQEQPELLEQLVSVGAVPQLTAAAVDGRMGKTQERCSFALLERELACLVASDAHAPLVRASGLSAARDAVGDEALGRWLTEGVPAALLAGEPLPDRPPVRQSWWRSALGQ